MEKHHLDGQPEEARFYIPEGADNKGVPFGPEGEMPLTAAQEKIEQRRKKRVFSFCGFCCVSYPFLSAP